MEDPIFDDQTRSEMPIAYNPQPTGGFKVWLKAHSVWIAAILAVLLVGGIFWYFLSSHTAATPQSSNVILLMKGPSQITSDNEAEYTIIYRNGENAGMTDVSLEVLYPSGVTFKSATPAPTSASGASFNLPPVAAGADGQVVVRVKLSGSTGEDKEIRARLHYHLSNFNSEFVVEQNIHTSILPPDLTMDISGPVDVVNGQDATFNVTFTNVTAQDFDNLALQMTYPTGFSFSSAVPGPSKDQNFWNLDKLKSGSSASIEITGSFTGDNNEQQLVRADLGQVLNGNFAPQLDSTATFTIIPSSLQLTLTAMPGDVVKLGDQINYKLDYTNQGNIGLNHLVVSVALSGVAIDFSGIQADGSTITGQTLSWKAASDPNLNILSPNETGEINFTVPIKSGFTSNLKNQSITATASISSDEITKPTKAPDVQVKLISALTLQVNGDYISGAAPMQVGQTTLFNMTFVLSNLSNDVSNAVVTASLPLPSSAWKNVIVPDAEKANLTYDPNSGKIKWAVGDLPAFTGQFSVARQVSFQLEVTPSDADHGRTITLLKDVQATGLDNFVQATIQTDPITTVDTGTINDDTMNSEGSSVQ